MTNNPSPDLVSIGRAAEILGVSIDTVRRWEENGKLRAYRSSGGHRQFSLAELETFQNNRPFSISEAAAKLGVSASTLRRYESQGLIQPGRKKSGERTYTDQILQEFQQNKENGLHKPKKSSSSSSVKSNKEAPRSTTQPQSNVGSGPTEKPSTQTTPRESLNVHSAEREAIVASTKESTTTLQPGNDPLFIKPSLAEKTEKYNIKQSHVPAPVPNSQPQFTPDNSAKKHWSRRAAQAFALLLLITGVSALALKSELIIPKQSVKNTVTRGSGSGSDGLSFAATIPGEANEGRVLAISTDQLEQFFEVNVPAIFNDQVTVGELEVQGLTTLIGNVEAPGIDVNLGSGRIFASNIVNSLQGQTGDVSLTAGDGIEINGTTITNTSPGEDQDAFSVIAVGSTQTTASKPDDKVSFVGSGDVTLTLNQSTKTLTIDATSTEYTAGDDLVLSGTEFSIEDTLDSVSTINGLTTIDATTENTIEAAIFDADAESITGAWTVDDNVDFAFGTDDDWTLTYDETDRDQLLLQTTNTAANNTSTPLFEVLVGTTPTANQNVFSIAKGTPASNTDIFTVDEDGDVTILGATTLNSITYTWPPDQSAGNGAILTTNGNGTLSWESPADSGATADVTAVGTCESGGCFTNGNDLNYSLIFEGATVDDFEISFGAADATADRTITLPDADGTVILSDHTLTGDVTATIDSDGSTSATVGAINGATLGTTTATSGNLLIANGTQWQTVALSGDATVDSSGTLTIADDSVDESMLNIANSASDEFCLTYESDSSNFQWASCDAAGAFTSFIISDGSNTETVNNGETITFVDDTIIDFTVSATNQVTATVSADTIDGTELADAISLENGVGLSFDDGTNTLLTLTDSGTTGDLSITGDLTISGDDLFLGTNTSGYLLVADGTNFKPVALSSDATIDGSGALTIANNAVALTTDTTGNYVATIADAGNTTVTVTNGSAEGGAVTIDVIDVNCTDCLNATEIEDIYLLNTGDTGTGVYDFGGADSFEIVNSDTPTVNANGEIAFDNTVTDFSTGVLRVYGSDEEQGVLTLPIAQFTSPSDGYVVAYNASNDEFELVADNSGGSLSSFDISSDSGTDETINDGNVLEIAGGTGISTATSANDTITVTLSHLGLQDLTDPNADRIFFWDDGAGASAWLSPDGTTIEILGTTLQIPDNGIALATKTTGNYVATLADAGSSTLTVTGSGSENATVTIDVSDDAIDGSELADSITLDAGLTLAYEDAATNSVTDVLTLTHSSSGTPTDGLGAGLSFQIEDLGGIEEQASIDTTLTTVTDASEESDIIFSLQQSGAITEIARFDGSADALDIAGDLSIDGDGTILGGQVTLGSTTQDGSVVIHNDGVSDYTITIQPHGTQTQDITYTLPADDGSSSELLSTDGSGNLSWITVAGAGGGDGDIQSVGDCTDGDCFTGSGGDASNTLTFTSDEVIDGTTDGLVLFTDSTNNLFGVYDEGTNGSFRLYEQTINGTNHTSFKAPASLSSDLEYTLPSSIGGNDYVLAAQTDGTLSWESVSGGLGAGGDVTDVGDCSSDDCFTADGTGNSLYFEGSTTDGVETILTADDPTTSDKTITLPNRTGTVILSGDTFTGDVTATLDTDGSTALSIAADVVDGDELADAITLDASTLTFDDGTNTLLTLTDSGTTGDLSITGDLTISGDDLFLGTNTSGYLLVADGTNFKPVALSSDATIDGSGALTIANNAVALTTDTTGNYVASITNGSSITGGDGGSEGATLTLDVADDSIDGTELADTLTLDAALVITQNNSGETVTFNYTDTGAALDDTILITGANSTTVTDAIDVSDAEITNAINIGANVILGTTGTINFTNFDVDSSGNITGVNLTSTGVVDFGGATSVELPSGTSVTTDATGEIALDTNGDGSNVTHGVFQYYDGSDARYLFGSAAYPDTDGHVLTFDSVTNAIVWEAAAGSFNSFTLAGDTGDDQTISDSDTVTIATDGNLTATGGATDTVTISVDADAIDTAELADTLTLGTENLDINLDSTGEFAIQDGGADIFHVADDTGTITISDDLDLSFEAAENFALSKTAASTVDLATISDGGNGTTTSGVDGLFIDFTQATDAASDTNAGLSISATASGESGDTLYGANIATAGIAAGTLYGVNIAGITASGGTEYALNVGTGWDRGLYVQSTSEFTQAVTYSGSGRPTRQVTLSPEYEGASLSGDGSSNTGTMTSDFCAATTGVGDLASVNTGVCNSSGDLHSYYSWTTGEGSAQDYDVVIRWRVPDNFDSWDSNPIDVFGKRTDATNNAVTVYVYDTANTLENSGGTQVAGTSWTSTTVEASFAGTYTPGSYMTILIRMTADTGGDSVQVGEINLDYLSDN